MRKVARRWGTWILMAIGFALFMGGMSAALAATADAAPGYDTWFQIAIGAVIALVAAYAKGLESRIGKNERRHDDNDKRLGEQQRMIDREYMPKDEILQQMQELRASVTAVHRRLDFLRVPAAHASPAYHVEAGG